MTALTADRTNLICQSPEASRFDYGVRSTVAPGTFYVGGLVMKGADGLICETTSSADQATAVCVGVSRERTNSVIQNPFTLSYWQGIFNFANSTSTDLIADVPGVLVFAADDQTAAKTSNSGVRPILGRVVRVDPTDGVYVSVFGNIPSGTLA